eukprot:maker-scaffold_46-snap-gene-1.96-mRNA-1 protein AED:0.07 eAED:0.07 QI:101/0.33/0.25/1/1/1/4/0/313
MNSKENSVKSKISDIHQITSSSIVLNSSCEACRSSKVRCTREAPCQRCQTKGVQCIYSPRKKRGKARQTQQSNLKQENKMQRISQTQNFPTAQTFIPNLTQIQPVSLPNFVHPSQQYALQQLQNIQIYQNNEVSKFCMENMFPIQFIDKIIQNGINTFKLASLITEEELVIKFGQLSFSHLMKWRNKMKLYKNESVSQFGSPLQPVLNLPNVDNGIKRKKENVEYLVRLLGELNKIKGLRCEADALEKVEVCLKEIVAVIEGDGNVQITNGGKADVKQRLKDLELKIFDLNFQVTLVVVRMNGRNGEGVNSLQ